ncbi:unnamed protein product [Closterium sp. NIES-65]|nr:unnamed protein product [Closterium sp. NIES-65]
MGFAGDAVVVAAGRPSQSSTFECDESQTASHCAIHTLSKARLHLAEAMALARHWGRTLVLPRVCSSHIGGNNLPRGMIPACAYFDMVGADGAVCAVGARGVSLVPAWEGRGGASSGEREMLAHFQGHEYQESSCRQQGNASSGRSKHPSQLLLPSPSGFFLSALCFCFSPNSLSPHLAVLLACSNSPSAIWQPQSYQSALKCTAAVPSLLQLPHYSSVGESVPVPVPVPAHASAMHGAHSNERLGSNMDGDLHNLHGDEALQLLHLHLTLLQTLPIRSLLTSSHTPLPSSLHRIVSAPRVIPCHSPLAFPPSYRFAAYRHPTAPLSTPPSLQSLCIFSSHASLWSVPFPSSFMLCQETFSHRLGVWGGGA